MENNLQQRLRFALVNVIKWRCPIMMSDNVVWCQIMMSDNDDWCLMSDYEVRPRITANKLENFDAVKTKLFSDLSWMFLSELLYKTTVQLFLSLNWSEWILIVLSAHFFFELLSFHCCECVGLWKENWLDCKCYCFKKSITNLTFAMTGIMLTFVWRPNITSTSSGLCDYN